MSDGRVRIESPEALAGFFLVEGETDTALFVRPAQRIFLDARRSTRLTQVFIPVDPDNPCREWLVAAKHAGVATTAGDWHCERAPRGDGGGSTIEYRVVTGHGQSDRRWIDPVLAFPIRLRSADGTTIALEHVHLGAQPARLFDIPP